METDEQTVDQTSSEGNVKENGESEKDEKSAEEETEAAPAVKHLEENELFSQYYLVGPYVWHFAITHYHVSTHPIVDTSGIIFPGFLQVRENWKRSGNLIGQLSSTENYRRRCLTPLNKRYHFLTSSDRFLVPVRSAVKSYFINWCCQNLSKRASSALTVQASMTELGKLFQIFTIRAEKNTNPAGAAGAVFSNTILLFCSCSM